MKIVRLITNYDVKGNKAINLTVTSGNGQLAAHLAKIGTKTIAEGVKLSEQIASKGTALKGKTLKITSVVTALNSKTKNVNVSYGLKGGAKSEKWTSKELLDTDQTIIFYAEIKFT